jgi:hypothetical protein
MTRALCAVAMVEQACAHLSRTVPRIDPMKSIGACCGYAPEGNG